MTDLLDIETNQHSENHFKIFLKIVVLFHLMLLFLITSTTECICPKDELSFLYRTASN